MSDHGATDFVNALQEYLRIYHPGSPPVIHDSTVFDIFHHVLLLLPANIHIANDKRICKVRANPAVPRQGDKKALPSYFDCALLIDDAHQFQQEGGYKGMCRILCSHDSMPCPNVM